MTAPKELSVHGVAGGVAGKASNLLGAGGDAIKAWDGAGGAVGATVGGAGNVAGWGAYINGD